MWAKDAGSSSVFRRAFWLSSAIASASSTTKTRCSPSNGRYGAASMMRCAYLFDEVLRAGRAKPRQIGMGRRVGSGSAARRIGVWGTEGQELRRKGSRRGPLARARGAREEVRVGRRLERARQRDPRRRLIGGRLGEAPGSSVAVVDTPRFWQGLEAPRRGLLIPAQRELNGPRPRGRAVHLGRLALAVDDDDPLRMARRRARRTQLRQRAGTRPPPIRSGPSRPPRPAASRCWPARVRGVGIHAQEHRHVGHARADDELHQVLDDVDAQAARRALIGGGRVHEAVADDVAARCSRGLDHPLDQVRPCGREQEELRHIAHLERGILEQRADPLGHLGAARLADQERVRAERLCEQRGLGRLARPVDALEGDEHGAKLADRDAHHSALTRIEGDSAGLVSWPRLQSPTHHPRRLSLARSHPLGSRTQAHRHHQLDPPDDRGNHGRGPRHRSARARVLRAGQGGLGDQPGHRRRTTAAPAATPPRSFRW